MASFSSAARRIILRGSNTRHILSCSSRSGSSLNHTAARSLSTVATTINTTHHAPSISYHYPHHSHTMSTVAAAVEEDSDSSDNEEEDELPLFSSISELHPSSLHAIENKMKLQNMTEIQHKTFVAASSGRDILGRARTGTGKTLAFLLPAIENALRLGRTPGPHTKENGGISILVLSPTRELAMQIHNQAQVLTSSHANSSNNSNRSSRMTSQVMFGGSSRGADLKKLEDNCPFVLVATPGRLIYHMQSSYVRGIPFREIIEDVSVFVLDEADRCLDMGFRNDMEYILSHKDQDDAKQQTLLFSATLPKDLRSIMASHMRKDYLTVDCVHDIDPASHTNTLVDQSYVTLPSLVSNDNSNSRWITGLVDIVQDITLIQNPDDFKVVVFFPTTAMCQFFSHLFNTVFKVPVLEIHSKKTQGNRTKVSTNFRKFKKGILFTTDVSARGVDYPNVTHVVQYGSADSRETYIHRLGRTGRAGKVGKGIIICGTRSEENQFVKQELKGLDVVYDERYQKLLNGDTVAQDGDGGGGINGHMKRKEINDTRLQKIQSSAVTGSDAQISKLAKATYRSLLGYNSTQIKNLGMRSKDQVVKYCNQIANQMGFKDDNMPRLSPKIVQVLGLGRVSGLNIGSDGGERGGFDNNRGGGRRDSYGGRGGGGRRDNNSRGRSSYNSRGRSSYQSDGY